MTSGLAPGFDANEFIKFVAALFAILNPITKGPLIVLMTPGVTSRQRAGVAAVAGLTVFVTLMIAARSSGSLPSRSTPFASPGAS